MKRITALLILCAVMLCGCQKGKPKDMPQEVYDIATGIVPEIEKAIDNETSVSGAMEKVNSAFDKISDIYNGLDDLQAQLKTLPVINDLAGINVSLVNLNNAWLINTNIETATKELKTKLKDLKKDIGM